MKRFLILFLAIFAASCSLDNKDNQDYTVKFVPVDSVAVPESVAPGQTYTFNMYYTRPSNCYNVSNDLYYYAEDNIRTVAIQALVYQGGCEQLPVSGQEMMSFQFICPSNYMQDSYTFRFYKGEDANGNITYLEKDVPVEQ